MTDGERLVWTTTFALVFDRAGDSVAAARAAAHAVEQLRAGALRQLALLPDEHAMIDEIVSVP